MPTKKKEKNKKKRKSLQIKAENGLVSTKMNLENNKSLLHPAKDISLKPTLHRSCKTLKYYKYIKISVTGDVSLLKIGGDPTNEEMASAWQEILIEYSGLIKTEKTNSIFKLWEKIEEARCKLRFINICLDYFSEFYDEEIANELVLHGYDFIEWYDDQERYNKQLILLENESKTLIVLLNQYYNEYKILSPDNETITKDEMYYEKELAVLTKEGYRVNKKKNTVFEYAAAVNAFIEQNKRLKETNTIKKGNL
jgi:hypothetical protein